MNHKFKKRYTADIVVYFSKPKHPYKEVQTKNGSIRRHANRLPSFLGFANSLGVAVATLKDWREQEPKFNDACAFCVQLQLERILQLAISGALTLTVAKSFVQAIFKDANELKVTDLDQVRSYFGLVDDGKGYFN